MHNPKITIIILAAGSSSRFGSPKQLLKWKKSNLLQHAIETARASNATQVILVLGANYELIKENINSEGVEIIKNNSWEKGLGTSISVGVKYVMNNRAEVDGILIMLADQPLIDSEYLDKMIANFNSSSQQIIASSYENKKQGVPVIFDKCYFTELKELNDDEGAKHLIRKHLEHVKTVKLDFQNLDIDTIEDYKKLYKANHQ